MSQWTCFQPENGPQSVNAVIFTPDNRRLVSASSDQTVRVWDQATGREVLCLRGHKADVNSVCVSPDGTLILSAAGDYWGGHLHDPTLRLWSLTDGSLSQAFEGHTGAVYGAAFTPDGKYAASASWDGSIRVWDVGTGKEIRRFGNSDFNRLAIHPQGRLLVSGSGSSDGKIQLWDLRTGEELFAFPCTTVAHDVAFSPDGTVMVSAHGYHTSRPARGFSLTGRESYVKDGVAIVWKTDTGEKKLRVGDSKVDDPTVNATDSNRPGSNSPASPARLRK